MPIIHLARLPQGIAGIEISKVGVCPEMQTSMQHEDIKCLGNTILSAEDSLKQYCMQLSGAATFFNPAAIGN